jgi:hypothetical protein
MSWGFLTLLGRIVGARNESTVRAPFVNTM